VKLFYSFIIPVYNRPQEILELLESFKNLDFEPDFEIVIVEDGSAQDSRDIIDSFAKELNIKYFYKENSGPGDSRNFGMQRAKGNYFIILDSDCVLPAHYLKTVDAFLQEDFVDCYGGADSASQDFTPLQKAINYTMTSFLTTGGIRGSKNSISTFEPRSFNMGISKDAFIATGGFAKIHPGEDPDLSQRIKKCGYKTIFLENAFVFHKRRISWKKFYIQVKKFGLVRPILNKWHPKAAKITYWFPSAFVFFVLASIILALFLSYWFLVPLTIYLLLLLLDATVKNKSLHVGFLSIIAMFIQFFGYGFSFLKSTFYVHFLNKDPKEKFPKLFFE